ncbi:unnamed protein product, partial [Urochloa humidicola]
KKKKRKKEKKKEKIIFPSRVPDTPPAAPQKPSPPSTVRNHTSPPPRNRGIPRNLSGTSAPAWRPLDGGERRPLWVPGRVPSPSLRPSAGAAAAASAWRIGDSASTVAALRHDPGLAARWSPEEQVLLDRGLAKFAADAPVVRYAKIAMSLPEKTVRDVALRCRWKAKKESSKKRKEELYKKSKEKKERIGDSSSKGPAHLVARPNAPSYTVPVLPIDDDDVSYKAIGGPTGQILEHNAQILNQIHSNISNMQVQDNLSLLCQTRDNILAVLKEVNNVPEIMRQMPPLPVKMNEDLANSILPRPPGT